MFIKVWMLLLNISLTCMKAPWSDFCFRARILLPELPIAAGRSRENKSLPNGCDPCPWGVDGVERAEPDAVEQEEEGMMGARATDGGGVEDNTADTKVTGEEPTWPGEREVIPELSRQVLGITEEAGGVTQEEEMGQWGPLTKLASLTRVLAVSWRPLDTRWFLISRSSSFSEKVILDWATTLAFCRRAKDTSEPTSSGFPDTRSIISAAYLQNRTCSLRLSCSTGSFISWRTTEETQHHDVHEGLESERRTFIRTDSQFKMERWCWSISPFMVFYHHYTTLYFVLFLIGGRYIPSFSCTNSKDH